MILWIMVIVLASGAVSLGIILLYNSKLPVHKKSKIMLVIGILIYSSLMISYFKQKRYLNFSLLNSRHRNDIESVFTAHINIQPRKYANIPQLSSMQECYKSNYESYPNPAPISYQQKILYISGKNQGATVFLQKLSTSFRNKNIPTLYLNVENPTLIKTQDQFSRLFNLPNFQIMQQILQSYHNKGTKVYIIIDNIDNLIINVLKYQNKKSKIQSILEFVIEQYQINTILNTDKNMGTNYKSFINANVKIQQFQERYWKKPTKQIFSKLYQQSIKQYNIDNIQTDPIKFTKLNNNFQILSLLVTLNTNVNKMIYSQEELYMKINTLKNSVINYFGIQNSYKIVKEDNFRKNSQDILGNLGAINNGYFRKHQINMDHIQKLQKLGIISIKQDFIDIV